MKTFKEFLNEVAIQFGGKAYPKFGNVVILSGGAGCFDGDTLVNTKNGYKKISDITKEDEVLSFNEETSESEYKQVVDKFEYQELDTPLVELEFDNGQIITCTETHKFFVDGEWVMAKDLVVG